MTSSSGSEGLESQDTTQRIKQSLEVVIPAYSVFSNKRKIWTVWLMALTTWFSPASSFIYFPAIVDLANTFHVSVGKINVTVTSYLVVSAVVPAIIGSTADEAGRRPVLIVSLVVYVLANVGLAIQRSYVALLLLRMLQSAGISGSVAISYGVVADMAAQSKRGGFVGIISFGANTAPALSPVIGTLLLYYKGWTSVFWFLAIASCLCLLLVMFTLQETARDVVDNGSVQPPRLLRLPFDQCSSYAEKPRVGTKTKIRLGNPLRCLVLLWDYNNAIVVYSQAVCYMVLTILQASLSSLFIEIYGLNKLQAGLIYLPFGIGCAIAAFFTGQSLDKSYIRTAKKHGFPVDKTNREDNPRFPIAQARLRFMPFFISFTTILVVSYGWALHKKAHISVPLVLQFFLGASIQSSLTTFNTLLTDLNMRYPSTAQASSNLVRCALAAAGTGILQLLLDRVGTGLCFTIWGAVVGSTAPGLCLLWKRSVRWTLERK